MKKNLSFFTFFLAVLGGSLFAQLEPVPLQSEPAQNESDSKAPSQPPSSPAPSNRLVRLPPQEQVQQLPQIEKRKNPEIKIFTPEIQKYKTMGNQDHPVEQSIRDFMRTLNQGDISGAYYAHTSKDFQKTVTPATFKQYININRLSLLNSTLDLDKPVIEGGVAKLRGKFAGRDSAKAQFELIYENGAWKVYRFDIFPGQ